MYKCNCFLNMNKMKKIIIVLSILSFLFSGCNQNEIEIGRIYLNQSFNTNNLPDEFKILNENVYIFSGEVQNDIFNHLEIIISSFKNDELIDTETKNFDLKLDSTSFNIFLEFNPDDSSTNICINSDKLNTYSKLLELSKLNNEFSFIPNTESTVIYSSGDNNYSNEILLGSLKEMNGSKIYDISFRLKYNPQ